MKATCTMVYDLETLKDGAEGIIELAEQLSEIRDAVQGYAEITEWKVDTLTEE